MTRSAKQETREIWISITDRIKWIRRDTRVALEELAKKTGFAKRYLSQIENLKREPQ
jgi:transcriptional regulator with XRE-family HTH domain